MRSRVSLGNEKKSLVLVDTGRHEARDGTVQGVTDDGVGHTTSDVSGGPLADGPFYGEVVGGTSSDPDVGGVGVVLSSEGHPLDS